MHKTTLLRHLNRGSRRLAERVKGAVGPDSPPGRLLRSGYRLLPRDLRAKRRTFAQVLDVFARSRETVFFVQIGSNDGQTSDPLHDLIVRDHWSGIMVEPVPSNFERLRATHTGRHGLIFENVAIGEREGRLDFWRVGDTSGDLPVFHDQIGSLSRDAVLQNLDSIPDLESRLIRDQVDCLRLATLLERHGVERIDLFHVDAEGFDAVILEQLDLDRFHPEIILWEHKKLAPGDRKRCRRRFERHGYYCTEEFGDTIALADRSLLWTTKS